MKLGVVSRIGEFPREYWAGEFETFGKNGMRASHLELISNYPYLGPADYTEKDIKLLRGLAEENELELTIHLLPIQKGLVERDLQRMFDSKEHTIEFFKNQAERSSEIYNLGSIDEKVRKNSVRELLKTLKMAKKLGARLITIHGGHYRNEQESCRSVVMARESLKEVNPYFTDIKLCVENLPTTGHVNDIKKEFPKGIGETSYMVKELDNVGICLDVGHANVVEDVLVFYDVLKKSGKLWDFHLHDNLGDKDSHLEIGAGNIPFWELFMELRKDNYKGFLSIELDTWCRKKMEKKERIEALKKLRKFL
jgi:sugar phosphate isomerase/epimerase